MTLSATLAGDKVVSATAAGVALTATSTVTVAAGAPSQLAFDTQPSNADAGVSIAPDITVRVLDDFGNLRTDYTSAVSLTIESGTGTDGAAFVSAPVSINAVGGIATFSAVQIDSAGTAYQLRATSGSLDFAVSSAFDITPGIAAAQSTATLQPVTYTEGVPFTITVQARDAFGNNRSGTNDVVAVTSASGIADPTVAGDNGVYTVQFTPTASGPVSITITINGIELQSSPLVIDVEPADGPLLVAAFALPPARTLLASPPGYHPTLTL